MLYNENVIVLLTFLVESIQLVLIVHVVVLASNITKCGITHVTLVDGLRMSCPQMVPQGVGPGEALFADVASVGRVLVC